VNGRDYSLGAASVVVGLVLLFGSTPFWWIGSGLIAGGVAVVVWTSREELADALEDLKRPRDVWGVEVVPARILAELLCVGILIGLNIAMLPHVTLGDRPTNHDHTVHFFKAWQLQNQFLAEGSLYGWSHHWFAGYPAQYLYPIGADLLVVALHTAALGWIDFGTAYACAIWMFWLLGGYAVYRLGVSAFGRWGALLAGILFMTDTAANRIGGWYFAMEWGVWPMSLATVIAVWAIARVPPLMKGDKWRHVASFGLLVAAALVTHPFMMIHLTMALVIALFAFWLAETDRHWLTGAARLGVGVVVGVLVAAIWLVPFFATKHFMDPHFGGIWENLLSIGRGFYRLDFLQGTWSMAIAFGVVGMFVMLWSRKFEHLLVGMLSVAFIIFGSTDFLAAFNFLDIFKSFQRVHFKRFITLLKPFFLLAAAYGFVAIVRYTYSHAVGLIEERSGVDSDGWESLQPTVKRWIRFVVIFLCLIPLAVPFAEIFGAKHVSRGLKTESTRPHRQARDEAAQWFQEKFPEGEPFFRVAMDLRRHDHRFVDFGRRIPFPVYKLGYTPATSFRYRFERGDPEVLRAVNVRYVLTLGGPPSGKFERVESFGALTLYEFENWNEEPVDVIEGSGPVELVDWSDEEIEVRAGEGAEGKMRLNVSNFDRWTAYRDGEQIPIEEHELDIEPRNGFIMVDLAPGTYRFVFERGLAEPLAFMLCLLGLLLALGFVAADTEYRFGRMLGDGLAVAQDRLRAFTDDYGRALDAAGAAGGILLVVVACGMSWIWPPLRIKGRDFGENIESVHYDFGDQLRDASVFVGKGDDPKPCREMAGYFICDRTAWKIVHQRVEDFGPELSMARCIWAHPVPEGSIEISFSEVPAAEAIVGYYGVPESGTTSGANPATLKVGYDGVYRFTGEATHNEDLYTFEVPIEEDRRSGSIDVRFQVSAENTGRRHFCFNAQTVDVEGEPELSESGTPVRDQTD